MVQNHVAEEDALKANKPMTITDGSVSFTSAPGDTSTVDVGGDVFLLNGTTADVTLNDSAIGTTTISFAASTAINLTAGSGHDVVTALKGTNTFTSASLGTLDVTGGVGADAYRLGVESFGLTVNDFSVAKGDTLTVDSFFKGSDIVNKSDGAGGTLLEFRNGPHHTIAVDLRGAIVSNSIIHYASVG
jgi:hypothetical protein